MSIDRGWHIAKSLFIFLIVVWHTVALLPIGWVWTGTLRLSNCYKRQLRSLLLAGVFTFVIWQRDWHQSKKKAWPISIQGVPYSQSWIVRNLTNATGGCANTHRRLTWPTAQTVDEAGVYSITRCDFVVAKRHPDGRPCLHSIARATVFCFVAIQLRVGRVSAPPAFTARMDRHQAMSC